MRVSWLKFEPWSRILLLLLREVFLLFCYIKNVSLTFVITHKVEVTKENDETMNEVASRNK